MKPFVCPYCNLHLEGKDVEMAEEYGGCPACGYGVHFTEDDVVEHEKYQSSASTARRKE